MTTKMFEQGISHEIFTFAKKRYEMTARVNIMITKEDDQLNDALTKGQTVRIDMVRCIYLN